MKKVSVSELIQFYTCKRSWYLQRVLKIKGAPFLPFIIGEAVHGFIANWVHRKTIGGGEFFYKTSESAQKGFIKFWLDRAWPKTHGALEDSAKWYALDQGKKCIANYYMVAGSKGRPLDKEKRLNLPLGNLHCELVGVIDQVRPTNPLWAKAQSIRSPGVVLIDLKTGRPQYWSDKGDEPARKSQTGLINNIQPTMYYYLYEQIYKVKPDGFVFWFLGGDSPRIVTTHRGRADHEDLFDLVRDFLRGISHIDIRDFPKTPNTYNCTNCQSWKSCWQGRQRPDLSRPVDHDDPRQPSGVTRQQSHQGTNVFRQETFKIRGTLKKKPTKKEKEEKQLEEYKRRMRQAKI